MFVQAACICPTQKFTGECLIRVCHRVAGRMDVLV